MLARFSCVSFDFFFLVLKMNEFLFIIYSVFNSDFKKYF